MTQKAELKINAPASRWREKILHPNVIFISMIILLELGLIVELLINRRLVLHDSFCRLSLQYFIMNNAVNYGELPQWVPYLTHGATALPWYSAQNTIGILLNGLALFPSVLKPLNCLLISYVGIFFDELILLCGTLLLADKIYSSRTTSIFVAISVLGSSIWPNQSYFNFHFIYGIPLLLYLFHQWAETAQWKYLFLSMNFLLIQSLGQMAYFIPIVTLATFVYVLTFILINPPCKLLERNSLKPDAWIPLLLFLLTALALFFIWDAGIKDGNIVRQIGGRAADGSVNLQHFLSYQGHFNFWKIFELLWGISGERDYTLYVGALTAVMILAGVFWGIKRKNSPMYVLALVFFLIASGTFMAKIVYYGWPLMKFYRHLHLLLPVVRLFLCFVAGFGLEAILNDPRVSIKSFRGKIFILSIVLVTAVLIVLTMVPGLMPPLAKLMGYNNLSNLDLQKEIIPVLLEHNIFQIAKFILAFLAVILILALRWGRHKKFVVSGLLIILFLDMYSYKRYEYQKRSVPMSERQYQYFQFQKLIYQPRRHLFRRGGNDRFHIISQPLLSKSSHYWTINALLLNDTLDTPLRTQYWQKAFNDYLKSWGRGTFGIKSSYNLSDILQIDGNNRILNKLSGVSEDKIQFFRHAHILTDKEQFPAVFNDGSFSGDVLLLLAQKSGPGEAQPSSFWSRGEKLEKNERIPLPYTVKDFQANRLRLSVDVTEDRPVWMSYSDVWHPLWKAKVNGTDQTVYRAQLAYKAVLLQPGNNVVDLYYGSKIIKICFFLLSLCSWFWIVFCSKHLLSSVLSSGDLDP